MLLFTLTATVAIAGNRLVNQRAQTCTLFQRAIKVKMHFRYYPDVHQLAQFVTQKSGGMIEHSDGRDGLFFVTQYRYVHFRMAHVTGYLHRRDTDHPQTRIVQIITYQLSQLTLDLLRDTAGSWKFPWHRILEINKQSVPQQENSNGNRAGYPAGGQPALVPDGQICLLKHSLQRAGHLDTFKHLDLVSGTDTVVLHANATLGASPDFVDVILEASQRFKLAFEDDHVIPQYTDG